MSSSNRGNRADLIVIPFLIALEKEPKHIEDCSVDEAKEIAKNVFFRASPKVANLMRPGSEHELSAGLEPSRKVKTEVETIIREVWGRPLTMLELLIEISHETAIEFERKFAPHVRNEEYLLRALSLLNSRGRQVSSEILHLLNGGYADGAYARWRTLYELAVVARFIVDPKWAYCRDELAKRYLYHSNIMKLKKARNYQEYCKDLKCEPLSDEEIAMLEVEKDRLCKLFGSKYNKDYGWAEKALADNFQERFIVLEKAIGLERMRPYFALASTNIHAGAWGDAYRLGIPPSMQSLPDTEIAISGSSIYGLTLPMHSTAMFLELLTSSKLLIVPTRQGNALSALMMAFSDEIRKACLEAEEHLNTFQPRKYP